MRVVRCLIVVGVFVGLVGCSGNGGTAPSTSKTTTVATTVATTMTTTAAPTTTTSLPPVTGPDPSPRVLAFYYPWYGTDEFGGDWEHWGDMGNDPATDVTSDYYPALGPYSSYDPLAVAQHMAWLREAGVGAVVTSWWGRGTFEDGAVSVVLDAAEHYGLQVALHIEPYDGRDANRLVADVEYILDNYGDHPAFYRTTETSRWNDDPGEKGLFFLWNAGHPSNRAEAVESAYWQTALDAIHEMGAVVIADIPDGAWLDPGHFDGLYNYATLELEPEYAWARTIPPDGWFVPSVIPGFSAVRIGYDQSTFVPRNGGATYNTQWTAALATGIEPTLVTITSFNEWHEGTQIEPAEAGRQREPDQSYADYGSLGPKGYLELTALHVAEFLATQFMEDSSLTVRIEITTTSDWTTLTLLEGGQIIRPEIVSVDSPGRVSWEGERLALLQPIADAELGSSVAAAVNLAVLDPGEQLTFRIERGSLGASVVELSPLEGAAPGASAAWEGTNSELVEGEFGRNPFTFIVTAADLGG